MTSCSCSPGACHGGHTINMGMPVTTAPNLTTCDHEGCGAIFPGVPLVGRTHAHEERAAHADWHLSNKYMRTDRCPDHWPTDGEVEEQTYRLADEELAGIAHDPEPGYAPAAAASMAGELLAARARVTELEAERDLWKERAENGQLHRDDLIKERNDARADAGRAHGQAGALHARVMELRLQVTARDKRITELEAAQREPIACGVLDCDDINAGPIPPLYAADDNGLSRARADAQALANPNEPPDRYIVVELREVTEP